MDIKEDIQSQKARQRTIKAQKRIRELITEFGTAKAKDREGINHGDSDVESDAEIYENIQSAIVVKDWVNALLVQHWSCGI